MKSIGGDCGSGGDFESSDDSAYDENDRDDACCLSGGAFCCSSCGMKNSNCWRHLRSLASAPLSKEPTKTKPFGIRLAIS